jgi:hypothetical protein
MADAMLAMPGYLDCTSNEILAVARGLHVETPRWLFPDARDDDASLAPYVNEGRSSLYERGLARTSASGVPEIDPNLATAVEIMSDPALIMGVARAAETAELSWLLARPDLTVVVTGRSMDAWRVRSFESRDLLATLCNVARIAETAAAKDVDLHLAVAELRQAMASESEPNGVEYEASSLARRVEFLHTQMVDVDAAVSVQVAYCAADSAVVRRDLVWIADPAGALATVQLSNDGLRVTGLTGSDLIARLRGLLPS